MCLVGDLYILVLEMFGNSLTRCFVIKLEGADTPERVPENSTAIEIHPTITGTLLDENQSTHDCLQPY